jgi:hypothetical protein
VQRRPSRRVPRLVWAVFPPAPPPPATRRLGVGAQYTVVDRRGFPNSCYGVSTSRAPIRTRNRHKHVAPAARTALSVTIGSRAKRQSEAVEDVTAERCHASGATMLDQQQKMQSVVMNQQAQAPATGNLQFMDSSNYGSGGGYGGGGYSGPGGGGGAGYYQQDYSGQIGGGAIDFDNEPPLLEELGIDFDKIVKKTISVLDPTRRVTREMMYSTSIHTGLSRPVGGREGVMGGGRAQGRLLRCTMSSLPAPCSLPVLTLLALGTGQEEADSDMAGPILVALALGAAMLLRGKVHFGHIYGLGVFGCCSLWLVMTLMSHKGVDIYQVGCSSPAGFLPHAFLVQDERVRWKVSFFAAGLAKC